MSARVAPTAQTVRVLVIEDDLEDFEEICALLRSSPRGIDYHVERAATIEAGLSALTRQSHDVCLLDCYLGDRISLSLLEEATRIGTGVPIVLLTGRGDDGIEQRALAAGAADYLAKGHIDRDSLERSIRHSIERHRTVEAMQERQRELQRVFEGTLDAMLVTDDEGGFLDGNTAALALLGISHSELARMSLGAVAASDPRSTLAGDWRAFLQSGRMEGEMRVRRGDGDDRIVEYCATSLARGRHLVVLRDVSERRLAEHQRFRLEAMVECAADAIEGLGLDGVIDYWSPAASRLYGYSSGEAIGQHKTLVVPEEKVAEMKEMLGRARSGESIRDRETLRRRKDGTVFDASVSISPVLQDGRIVAAVVITRDVSEKKKLEAHLALSDRMVSVGTLAAGLAHEINNPLAAVVSNLQFLAQGLGIGREGETSPLSADVSSQPGHRLAFYDNEEECAQLLSEFLLEALTHDEPVMMIATGAHVSEASKLCHAHGVDIGSLVREGRVTIRDARETLESLCLGEDPTVDVLRERLVTLLRSVRRRAGEMVHVFGEVVDLLVKDGRPELASRLEEAWTTLTGPERLTVFCAYDTGALRTPDSVRLVCEQHDEIRKGSCESASAAGAWTLGQLREITREIRLRKNAEFALRFAPVIDVEVTDSLRDARDAADRIGRIVRDLKLFSRPDEERRGPVDVRRVIESTLRMARNEIRHRATLVRELGEIPRVYGNEARLGQVFLNLVVNAAQAIREGDAAGNEIRLTTRRSDDGQVLVEIRDSGAGIPPEALSRLFEPFFTTKPVGIGTGLGLSICRRIVHEHGGSITVESEVGRGTTFRVVLPPTTIAQADASPSEPAATRRVPRGRVLLVDDEHALAKAVRRALPHHDLDVATTGLGALERLQQGHRYDVILCDMMMPQMTGMDFYQEVSRSFPEVLPRIVFLTGGAFTPGTREFLERTSNLRIEKPFDAVQLRRVVDDRVVSLEPEPGNN